MTPCTLFVGYTGADGYGRQTVKRKVVLAHRQAYAVANGWDVTFMGGTVMHLCDVRGCINPEHLVLASQQANIADMVRKGRQHRPTGEVNPNATLTEANVNYIRSVYIRNHKELGGAALGRRFGVSGVTINSIIRGKLWNLS